jgi:hypothetical protein
MVSTPIGAYGLLRRCSAGNVGIARLAPAGYFNWNVRAWLPDRQCGMCRCTPVASPQKTFPDDATDTPRALRSMVYNESSPEGMSKCSRHDCESHCVHAWAKTPPRTLVEIDVGTKPAIVEIVSGGDPLVTTRMTPLCSPNRQSRGRCGAP